MRKFLLTTSLVLTSFMMASAQDEAVKSDASPEVKKEEAKEDEPCNQGSCKSTWDGISHEDQGPIYAFADDYKAFLSKARTELTSVSETIALAKAAGFTQWTQGTKVKAGQKYYHENRGRALILIVGGNKGIKGGVRISAAHIDSPRLELKGRPVYGKAGFALFQTNYHGGIKTHQWANIPLALVGRVDKKDGTTINISIGLDADDPIMIIPDLAPHVSYNQKKRSASEVLTHEELDPIVASGPHKTDAADKWLFAHLKSQYNVDAADLVSAELALVPAMPPRDVGFDRRLTAAYGQDDRLSSYAGIRAALDMDTPEQTAIIYLSDNEETGFNNVTGARSSYLTDMISELLYAELGSKYREPELARVFRKSKTLSIDVNVAINPISMGVLENSNASKIGHGISIKLYGRGSNANSEFIAWTRAAFDDAGIPWQTTAYKVARGGGGTLGREISKYNIDTLDLGAPILSMHSPYSISDKSDVYNMYRGITAFHMYNPDAK